MPNMNGLEFLEKIMRLRPMPVIRVSTMTHQGANAKLAALEIGAFDCVSKPVPGDARPFGDLAEKVKAAARSKRGRVQAMAVPVVSPAAEYRGWTEDRGHWLFDRWGRGADCGLAEIPEKLSADGNNAAYGRDRLPKVLQNGLIVSAPCRAGSSRWCQTRDRQDLSGPGGDRHLQVVKSVSPQLSTC